MVFVGAHPSAPAGCVLAWPRRFRAELPIFVVVPCQQGQPSENLCISHRKRNRFIAGDQTFPFVREGNAMAETELIIVIVGPASSAD